MQLIILIYHMTGASKEISIYMLMRLLVSSYLFLNGFGHFSFFWKEKEREEKKKMVQLEENGLSPSVKPENNHQGLIRCVSVSSLNFVRGIRDTIGGGGVNKVSR